MLKRSDSNWRRCTKMSNWNSIASFPEKNTCVRALECKWNGRHNTLDVNFRADILLRNGGHMQVLDSDSNFLQTSTHLFSHNRRLGAIEDFKILMCKLQVNARSMTQFAVGTSSIPLLNPQIMYPSSTCAELFTKRPIFLGISRPKKTGK